MSRCQRRGFGALSVRTGVLDDIVGNEKTNFILVREIKTITKRNRMQNPLLEIRL